MSDERFDERNLINMGTAEINFSIMESSAAILLFIYNNMLNNLTLHAT